MLGWCGNSPLFPACPLAGVLAGPSQSHLGGNQLCHCTPWAAVPYPVDPWIEQLCCGDPLCVLAQPRSRRARPLVLLMDLLTCLPRSQIQFYQGVQNPQKTEEEISETEVPAPPASMAANPLPPPDPQFVLRGTQSAVHALHFFGGAQGQERPLLLSGSLSGLVHIWSLQTRRAVATLDGHGGQCVTWLRTLPQGHQLLSQGRDLKLRLWDLAEGRNTVVDSVALESMGFCRSSVLAGAQERWMLAVPGRGSDEVQILEMPSKTSVCTLKPEADAKPGMPMCLELWQADSSPRPLLLAGYEDGSVALWDVSERKVCSRVACHTEPVMGFDFDSQKARGVSGSAEKALAVWSLDEQQALQVLPVPTGSLLGGLSALSLKMDLVSLILLMLWVCRTHELTNPGIADVKIRPDRKILATAGWDHRVRVFHWRTMKPLAVLSFHSATVHCVAFAADGLLAAGSGDQRISVWSLYPTHSDMSAPLLGHAEGREVGAHAVA
ncbi:guanine nucleotide-binding protein subunit beta-like protein 1 isoform X1 [Lutra lutra]|uniref:guanine nucleotide-binding protein subunit beta-like protein 1 isoform X1 n=1 Tax=Lutra lutra TaxID=9657 RepID=UPI001FD2A02D|nr:guanine nucleotide-binding protein subunit beta-like protein 1 isoform X1 [Lutra lutra]